MIICLGAVLYSLKNTFMSFISPSSTSTRLHPTLSALVHPLRCRSLPGEAGWGMVRVWPLEPNCPRLKPGARLCGLWQIMWQRLTVPQSSYMSWCVLTTIPSTLLGLHKSQLPPWLYYYCCCYFRTLFYGPKPFPSSCLSFKTQLKFPSPRKSSLIPFPEQK